jgi:cytoskeletal protein RodZ
MAAAKPERPRQAPPGWLPYALGGLVLVIGLLLALLPWGSAVPWLTVSLHSLLQADYSPDLNPATLPPPRLALAAEALRDQGFSQGTTTPVDFLATLQTGLQTPVATVTPRPGETLFPLMTPAASPTAFLATPTPFLQPTASVTPTWTQTPTPSATSAAGTVWPTSPPGLTRTPTRRPTNPGPGQPTRTPRPTATALPTVTPSPTLVAPTATPAHAATPTRPPTATEEPYPPPQPPYP